MDGDTAQLGWLYELARNNGARLMVDDAHAVGAVGPGGRGTVAEAGLAGAVDVVVSTLGKSLGGYGAYACLSAELRDLLVNTARPMIFSTGLPPAVAAAAEAALGILEAEPARVAALQSNAELLRTELEGHGLDTNPSSSQIVPVRIGAPERALGACHRLLDAGVFAQAIRPPTVPDGTSRLRLTAMATHRPAELRAAAECVAEAVAAVSADGDWSIDLPEPPGGRSVADEVASVEETGAARVVRTADVETPERLPH
jgi:glycine C-acetyltransferase/8-amino-7-oxononanoate synthase